MASRQISRSNNFRFSEDKQSGRACLQKPLTQRIEPVQFDEESFICFGPDDMVKFIRLAPKNGDLSNRMPLRKN